jgi:hypothetical protein
MGMQLPGEIREILSLCGFNWPEGDETKLLSMGQTWTSLSGQLDPHVQQAISAANTVVTQNKSEAIDAFNAKWSGESGPAHRLAQGGTGADIVGAGLMVCAGIVLALKVNVIVQATLTLIAIAEAVAAAFVTFGASAALVVVLREALKRLLDWLLNQAIGKVLGG